MVGGVLKQVFRNCRYTIMALGIAGMVLSATLLLPNLGILLQVFSSEAVLFYEKILFLLSLYGSIGTNFSLLAAINLVVISVLFGVNISLVTYYIRRQRVATKNTKIHAASLGGLISGILGIGCAACGSIVLTALLGIFGAGGIISLLPFHGAEFGLIGIILLLLSVYYICTRINDPLVCSS